MAIPTSKLTTKLLIAGVIALGIVVAVSTFAAEPAGNGSSNRNLVTLRTFQDQQNGGRVRDVRLANVPATYSCTFKMPNKKALGYYRQGRTNAQGELNVVGQPPKGFKSGSCTVTVPRNIPGYTLQSGRTQKKVNFKPAKKKTIRFTYHSNGPAPSPVPTATASALPNPTESPIVY